MKPEGIEKAAFLAKTKASDDAMSRRSSQRYAGSVSAEHGIGLLKKDALRYSRTPEELAIFAGLEKLLDPRGILNPGKIFD
jgi:FAD/FMN-containing dehydrogenase